MVALRARFIEWGHPGGGAGVTAHKHHTSEDEIAEANAAGTFGALNRPGVARMDRKIKVVPKDRMSEDVSAATRKRTETLPGGGYPMPDKKHASLALSMINRGDLSPSEKTTVRNRADRMLGKK